MTSVIERERQRLLIEDAKQHAEVPDPAICRLFGWKKVGAQPGYLLGTSVQDHPKLGTVTASAGRVVFTTMLKYFNPECGIAVTKNTVYVLVGPEQK